MHRPKGWKPAHYSLERETSALSSTYLWLTTPTHLDWRNKQTKRSQHLVAYKIVCQKDVWKDVPVHRSQLRRQHTAHQKKGYTPLRQCHSIGDATTISEYKLMHPTTTMLEIWTKIFYNWNAKNNNVTFTGRVSLTSQRGGNSRSTSKGKKPSAHCAMLTPNAQISTFSVYSGSVICSGWKKQQEWEENKWLPQIQRIETQNVCQRYPRVGPVK